MVKAVFFDIDGTLVSFRTHRVPADALCALEQLRAKGVRLFIATGRSPGNLAFLKEQFPFAFDGYVMVNGQYCVAGDGTVLRRLALPVGSIRTLLPYLERTGTECAFLEEDYMYYNRIGARVAEGDRGLGITAPNRSVCDPARALTHTTYQLSAYISPEEETEFLRHLPGAEATRWCPYFADIIPAGGGKPVGMRAMCEYYGIPVADTMAFGDGGNDSSMLRAAGIGVAMGNGDEAAKSAADYVTSDIDAGGLAAALRHFGVIG